MGRKVGCWLSYPTTAPGAGSSTMGWPEGCALLAPLPASADPHDRQRDPVSPGSSTGPARGRLSPRRSRRGLAGSWMPSSRVRAPPDDGPHETVVIVWPDDDAASPSRAGLSGTIPSRCTSPAGSSTGPSALFRAAVLLLPRLEGRADGQPGIVGHAAGLGLHRAVGVPSTSESPTSSGPPTFPKGSPSPTSSRAFAGPLG